MPGSSNGNTSGPINESFSDGDFEFENVRPNRTPHLRAMTRAELAGPVHHSFLDHPKPPKDVTNRAIYALHHAIEKEVDYQKIRQNGRDDQTFGYILDRQIRHWLLLLKLKNTDYVVDLGSGYGNIVAFVAALAPQVRRVVGIENSQVCIDVMHKFLKEFEK
ncbi:hypothetical protein PENTCL1PPCAC_28696 [Pristionchus entomophagus]|uniref:Histone-lysine N-methyltransferase, H3 lysine-79 specific n=1 Tax=Pristionchus entomophagus TaxID=358040 RepID=A0AAV5UJL3_9BILA|nr:hypothetical protein PENTCL1PPCAC_28696 [Pristionchus entomophagus]